jgi:hypothetical protein
MKTKYLILLLMGVIIIPAIIGEITFSGPWRGWWQLSY